MDLLGIRLFFVDFILTTEQFAAISAWYVDQEVQLYVALGCFASPIECSFCHLTGVMAYCQNNNHTDCYHR